jgi:hypothetical protein
MLKASKGRDPTSRSPEALKKVLDKVQVQLFLSVKLLLFFIGTGLLGVRMQSKYSGRGKFMPVSPRADLRNINS